MVRSAFKSTIPLISAIGHETDTTLLDYVADVRAPTPSAAAEMAVPVRHELLALLDNNEARLSRALSQILKIVLNDYWIFLDHFLEYLDY